MTDSEWVGFMKSKEKNPVIINGSGSGKSMLGLGMIKKEIDKGKVFLFLDTENHLNGELK